MIKISKIAIVVGGLLSMGGVSQASMADALIYNIAGQATNAMGARLGDEIYYGSSRKRTTSHRRHKKKRKRATAKKVHAPVMTDEKRIQIALASLGFYRGSIDGQVNSFETRSAIKKMNKAYNISTTASLKPEAKDTLIYLGNLFGFDKFLISNSTNPRKKNKKIQVALKLHGYYQGAIDGAIGRGTRGSIAQYKGDNGMVASGTLDFEEEYQLVSSAKKKNDKNIEESISSLESMGRVVQAPQYQQRQVVQPQQQQYRQPQQQAQQPVQTQQQYVQPQQVQQQVVQPQQVQQQVVQPQQVQQQVVQPQQQQQAQNVQAPQQQQVKPEAVTSETTTTPSDSSASTGRWGQ